MTDEEINAAIAEHLGWTNVRVIHPHPRRGDQVPMLTGSPSPTSKDRSVIIPNYCQDLNAMRQAEDSQLTSQQSWLDFSLSLMGVLKSAEMGELHGLTCLLKATARQRAEAFLKTVGKWREQ